MLRAALVCLIVYVSSVVLAQSHHPRIESGQGSPVQVVYVIDGTTLTTYDVDFQTLDANQVSSLTLEQSNYPWLVSSPNGRFLYSITYTGQIFVYMTDATGAPQSPPGSKDQRQPVFFSLQVDPRHNFLYMVDAADHPPDKRTYTIRRYLVDPGSGKISQPEVEAKYILPNDTEECDVSLHGFNGKGAKLYDVVNCLSIEGLSATYYERTLNPQTGALGPDVQIYSWSNDSGGSEGVQFVKNLMFDFVPPDDGDQDGSIVYIYPLVPNTHTPIVQCTASMLAACGNGGGVAHPSGKYLFADISYGTNQPDGVQIEKVELGAGKIVETANYIPYRFGQFNPDGTIVYAIGNGSPGIEIYGFDVSTGEVRAGGVIDVPNQFDSWFTAERR
ncbi:MAG: hypothetical protein WA609_13760 [Terriglobales bacterium]